MEMASWEGWAWVSRLSLSLGLAAHKSHLATAHRINIFVEHRWGTRQCPVHRCNSPWCHRWRMPVPITHCAFACCSRAHCHCEGLLHSRIALYRANPSGLDERRYMLHKCRDKIIQIC